jgi:hypothetical protein
MISSSAYPARNLTLKEAAVLSGVTEKAIRHELAASVVRSTQARRRLRFGPREVFFFHLVRELPFELRKEDRKDLFDGLVAALLGAAAIRDPARAAAVLARQARIPLLRASLHRLVPPSTVRQLPLL